MLFSSKVVRDSEVLREINNPSGQTITFDNIPQTHRHLRLIVSGRCDRDHTEEIIALRFNGDLGSNYDYQNMSASATVKASGELFGLSLLYVGVIPAAQATASYAGSFEVMIPNYTGTIFHKSLDCIVTNNRASSVGGIEITKRVGFWRDTSAITKIELVQSTDGNFLDGSTFILYGEL